MDGYDGAARIIVAGQKHGVFQLLEASAETANLRLEVGDNVFTFAIEIQQGVDVGSETEDFLIMADGLFQALAILQDLLAFCGLIPEIRRGKLFLESG